MSVRLVFCLFICVLAALSGCASHQYSEDLRLSQLEQPILVVVKDPLAHYGYTGSSWSTDYITSAYEHSDFIAMRRDMTAIIRDYDLSVIKEWPLKRLGVNCFVIRKPTRAVLMALENDSRVSWVQPFNTYKLQSGSSGTASRGTLVSRFLADIDQRGDDTDIVIIDTGADAQHPDLANSHVYYKDFVGDGRQGMAEVHGTAVLGIIAANPQDRGIVVGLAPHARVHHMRGCWQDNEGRGHCNTLTLALALQAAIGLRPQVVNLSLTGPRDRVLEALLVKLLAQGTLVIAAYDEQRPNKARFPSLQPGVVYAYGVGKPGVNKALIAKALGSRESESLLYAPGNALSLAPRASYELVSGHSVATPQIAAMLACFIQRDPQAGRAEIIHQLRLWLERQYLS